VDSSRTAADPTFLTHILDLRDGADACWHRFSSPVRRAIRKAERSGLQIDTSSTIESMRDFYRLHTRTRRRHGLPPQPFEFFEQIQREIIDRGLGLTVVASKSSTPISAAVFFRIGERALYKFGASDERHQEFRPANLVIWQGIRHLTQSGAASLHFGRTSPGDEGLRRFKLGWGAREVPLDNHQFRPDSNQWTPVHHRSLTLPKFAFSVFPTPLNRLLGAALYRHLD
jgi:lipid II:glycine glycyltransferase (peptidoglycan interpeptide bridge formation enzyme)